MIEKGKNDFTSPISPLPQPRTEKHQERPPLTQEPSRGENRQRAPCEAPCLSYLPRDPVYGPPPVGPVTWPTQNLCLCWLVNGFPRWHHSVKAERDCCLFKRAESNRRHRNRENRGTVTPPKGKSKASVTDPKGMDIYHWLIMNPKKLSWSSRNYRKHRQPSKTGKQHMNKMWSSKRR